jgi:hypothetical protein
MTKTKNKLVTDSGQMDLFDLLQRGRDEREASRPGRLCISAKLLAAVKLAIKQAPKSRETLADELTDLTGAEISVHMINNWTAESHPHHLPAEYLPALCAATGSSEPLKVLNDASGLFALDGPDALRADIQKKREARGDIDKQIKQEEALLRALEARS